MKAATPPISVTVANIPLFVYGTLMAPEVMESLLHRRVYGHPVRLLPSSYQRDTSSAQVATIGSNEEIRYDYSRHPVRNAVYPGLVHWNAKNDDKSVLERKNYVSGLLYSNLTEAEMEQLDKFEGDQYVKELCFVQRQHTYDDCNSVDAAFDHSADVVQAMVYVWSYPLSDLDLTKDWSYKIFEEQHLATYI